MRAAVTGFKEQIDRIVESIIFLVTESRRQARGESSRFGVTPTQLVVIKLLDEVGDLRLGELSRRISAQNSTVTGIVDRVEQAGLVHRYRDRDDRRVWRIGLTPAGRDLAARADVGHWGTLREALGALPPADQRRLIRLLSQVADNVARRVAAKE